MNFYDVLAAEKWDGGIPTINFFDLLFAQSISGEQWQTYEGTLPATLNANGSDMRQYQVRGATGGVGDKTVQLFDKNATNTNNGFRQSKYIYPDGAEDSSVNWNISEYIDISGLSNITIKNANTDAPNPSVAFYDNNYIYISSVSYNRQASINAQVPNNAKFCRISVSVTNMDIAMLTPSTTPPENYVPFGYEADIGVKSENIFDVETAVLKEYWINDDYDTFTYHVGSKCYFIPVSGNESYTITDFTEFLSAGSFVFRVAFTNEIPTRQAAYVGHTYRKQRINSSGATKHSASLTNNNYNYLAIQVRAAGTNNLTVSKGTTPPNEYQPYSNITTPIYIGDEPLDKDEYIDYQAGKIYRMINGVLTPTDPPVTLPALPTCEGTTIVDYAGQSVAPEKVLLEYAKGGN